MLDRDQQRDEGRLWGMEKVGLERMREDKPS